MLSAELLSIKLLFNYKLAYNANKACKQHCPKTRHDIVSKFAGEQNNNQKLRTK